jgi:hypothetical protein
MPRQSSRDTQIYECLPCTHASPVTHLAWVSRISTKSTTQKIDYGSIVESVLDTWIPDITSGSCDDLCPLVRLLMAHISPFHLLTIWLATSRLKPENPRGAAAASCNCTRWEPGEFWVSVLTTSRGLSGSHHVVFPSS